jgi:hypothetical protein
MTQNNPNTELQHTLHARDVETFCHYQFKVFLCEDTKLDNLEKILLNTDYTIDHSKEHAKKENCKTFYKKHLFRNDSIYIQLKL